MERKRISVNSTVKLEESSTSVRYKLVGNGIELTIEAIGGMEGISGLTGSLKSYAGSFGYSSIGAVEPMTALKNLDGARVSAKKLATILVSVWLLQKITSSTSPVKLFLLIICGWWLSQS